MAPWLTSVDSLRLQRYVTLPMILGGSVSPNPRFWPHLVRRQATGAGIQFLRGLRKKYGPRAWSWFPVGPTLLVFDREGINEVLQSETTFADPWVKKLQLSAFTPYGAIISRNPVWRPRRDLNDHALAFGRSQHPNGDSFITIVHDAVAKMLDGRESLAWNDFRTLAARISQQVIFGSGEYREDLSLHLARLVAASNWGIRRWSDFSAFYRRIDEHLNRRPRPHGAGPSLVHSTACWLAQHPDAADVEASSQIAFWLFVMKDAIELHTVRTLALIASAPEAVRCRLSRELHKCTPLTTATMANLQFLEACITEALRLWTPVPVLLRVAVRDTELKEPRVGKDRRVVIAKDRQVLVHTGLYHRDPEVFGAAADRFAPAERAAAKEPNGRSVTDSDPPLYVFSDHQQSCAGQFLVIFLLKAVLATLLVQAKFVLLDGAVAIDPVPAAIDHFAIRFWRRCPGASAFLEDMNRR